MHWDHLPQLEAKEQSCSYFALFYLPDVVTAAELMQLWFLSNVM